MKDLECVFDVQGQLKTHKTISNKLNFSQKHLPKYQKKTIN